MESRLLHEQEVPDQQRIVSAGSNSHGQRPSPCRYHFQDSTTARTVLATILEIILTSGDDLNLAYLAPQPCPMLKCFHFSATPMEQINHVAACAEASKGEIRCWSCRKCHDFKRWHAVCNTLMSPVGLLKRLSTRKRGSNTSTGEPSTTKRVCEDLTSLSRQESHGVENLWQRELEDPDSIFLSGVTTTSGPAQLHADTYMPELGDSTTRPLPTPPSTRNHSWSEDSQNLIAYGDAKVTHVPERLPPYIVSPQTTVDDCQRYNNPTGSLGLRILPVQYNHESSFMASPEDMEIPEADQAPWAHHAVFHEAGGTQVLPLAPTAPDAKVSAQYSGPSEKSVSMFSSSFADPRMPDQRKQKQNTWPTERHSSNNISRQSFHSQQPHILQVDGVSALSEQNGAAATARLQNTRTEPPVTRQTSFEAGAQDSITVSILDKRAQTTTHRPEDEHQTVKRRGPRGMAAQRAMHNHRHFEECDRCGQRFGGELKNRRQHLKRHVASKHGDVRFRCGHPGCSRSYNRIDNLHDHERKCHQGLAMLPAEVVAELAAGGDADVRVGGGGAGQRRIIVPALSAAAVAEVEGSAPDTPAHQTSSGAVETHFGVFGYLLPTEEGRGWHPAADDDARDLSASRRVACLTDEWDALMAGVSGGQHEGDEAGFPHVGHEADTPDEDVLSNGGAGPEAPGYTVCSMEAIGRLTAPSGLLGAMLARSKSDEGLNHNGMMLI